MAGCYVCRFLLGAVLVFSGFVKAVDPMGTAIKLEEYLKAFGMSDLFYDWLLLLAAMSLATLEFAIGIYLMIGIRRQSASTIALILMSVMTPLTLYLWIANPVSDCGCFGDALVMTNAESFGKNVALFFLSIVTFTNRARLKSLITPKTDWIIQLYAILFPFILSAYCLRNLPILDFRPYRIGVHIPTAMSIPEGATPDVWESRFVLEKNGEKRTFTLDEYPDSTWTYLSTESVLKQKGYQPPIHDFSIQRLEDGAELTDSLLSAPGYTFLLIAPHLEESDDSNIDLINEIYDYCVEHTRVALLLFPMFALYFPLLSVFQGMGRPRLSAAIVILELVIRIICIYTLGGDGPFGYTIIWWNMLFGWAIAMATTFILYGRIINKARSGMTEATS